MTKDQIDPYDDLDPYDDNDPFAEETDDWLDADPSEDQPADPGPDMPAPERRTHTPAVIQPDDDEDDDLAVDAEEFDDFTPRRTRFEAPRHEDVLVSSAKKRPRDEDQLTPAERKAKRREDKIERKRARAEAKQEPPSESDAPARPKKKQTAATAAGVVLILGAVAGGGWYLTASDDVPAQVASTEQAEAPTSSASAVDSESPGEARDDASAPVGHELYEVITPACEEAGGTNSDADASSAEGAIRAFNYAYFAAKSAEMAAPFLHDDMYNTVDTLQEGIDNPENGDAHCTIITSTDDLTRFEVEIQEFVAPAAEGEPITSWSTRQEVKLENADGRWQIVSQSLL